MNKKSRVKKRLQRSEKYPMGVYRLREVCEMWELGKEYRVTKTTYFRCKNIFNNFFLLTTLNICIITIPYIIFILYIKRHFPFFVLSFGQSNRNVFYVSLKVMEEECLSQQETSEMSEGTQSVLVV